MMLTETSTPTAFKLKYFEAKTHEGSPYVRIDKFAFQDPIEDQATRRKVWREYLSFLMEIKKAGFSGWIGYTRTDNVRFRNFLKKTGVKEYGRSSDGVYVYLMKKVVR